MRRVREILRLKYELGLADRRISRSLGVARSTVGDQITRARMAGIGWPLPAGMGDEALECLLFRLRRQTRSSAISPTFP